MTESQREYRCAVDTDSDCHCRCTRQIVVSTSAWHAAGRGFDSRTRHVSLLGVKTWLSTLEIGSLGDCLSVCLSEETLR